MTSPLNKLYQICLQLSLSLMPPHWTACVDVDLRGILLFSIIILRVDVATIISFVPFYYRQRTPHGCCGAFNWAAATRAHACPLAAPPGMGARAEAAMGNAANKSNYRTWPHFKSNLSRRLYAWQPPTSALHSRRPSAVATCGCCTLLTIRKPLRSRYDKANN
jgi:hypothetical protein